MNDFVKGDSSIELLFPTPVYCKNIEYEINDNELNLMKNITKIKNTENTVSVEKYILNLDDLNKFKHYLEKEVSYFFYDILQKPSSCVPYITQSWLNLTEKGESHHMHSHSNSYISGVFYIQTNVNDRISFIVGNKFPLKVDNVTENLYNSMSWWLPVHKNMLILFPSHLTHFVTECMGDETRISLSFNTFLKGKVGTYETSTELFL